MCKTMFAVLATLALIASPGLAQQNTNPNATPQADQQQPGQQVEQRQTRQRQAGQRQTSQRGPAMRASDLNGMEVRDAQGEDLGDIDDLVIDLQTGRVRYAALSVGGVLGVGGDLYAVPWSAFQLRVEDGDDYHLVLNATSQQFENAPGFDDDNWPNMADPQWQRTNDAYYTEQGIATARRDGRGRGGAGIRGSLRPEDREREGAPDRQPRTRQNNLQQDN